MIRIIQNALVVTILLCASAGAHAQSISHKFIASHMLGFSGAIVSIIESYRLKGWPILDRTFVLTGANGQKRKLQLQEGGGPLRNLSLNLFKAADDRFLIISERDCVEFDPIRIRANYCKKRPACVDGVVQGPTYLGRFDWMTAYDAPKGAFQWRFRFGPFEDALEGGSCPRTR